jgi:hypothetical protein
MSRFIKDELQITAGLRTKGNFLTLALMEIRRTRAERLLLLHAENGHGNIFANEKIFATEEQYDNQNKKI